MVSLCAANCRKFSSSKDVSKEEDVPSQSESGGNEGGINHGRKTDGGEYLSCIFGFVVPMQELDMLRNNVVWIPMLAETALIERERQRSREEWIPEFPLQFLDLPFKIYDEGCLFLEFGRSDQVVSAKVGVPLRTLEEFDACMTVVANNLARRVTGLVTHASLLPPPDRQESPQLMAGGEKFHWEPASNPDSIAIPGLNTAASTADQIEQIDQLITLKLQVSFIGARLAAADQYENF